MSTRNKAARIKNELAKQGIAFLKLIKHRKNDQTPAKYLFAYHDGKEAKISDLNLVYSELIKAYAERSKARNGLATSATKHQESEASATDDTGASDG